MLFRRRKRILNSVGIDFDEVLMDSHNLSSFDTQQFEGRIEKPISTKTIWLIVGIFVLTGIIFTWRLGGLQIKKGDYYFALSERNSLDSQIIFADRGVIFDRNDVELAWNERTDDMEEFDFSHRAYIDAPGHSLLLGYIKYPQKDKAGFYWQTHSEGLAGTEKLHDDLLNGKNGSKIVEADVRGDVISENIVNSPIHGRNLKLTVDSRLQSAMYESIKELAERVGYVGGAGLLMDIKTGELLVATSYPEYDSETLSSGQDRESINAFINDPNKPFLNRTVSGLYSLGSTVKPFIALGALNEGIINANTRILSTGQIEIPNPYNPDQVTIFRDWKDGGHGSTDVTKAIAESVNTFFYAVGGGYKGQKGLGISGIEKYINMFDIGDPTGVDMLGEVSGTVPSPEWKKRVFDGDDWRLGDTYNTSIGQYGFQATPIEMLRAVATIGNGGTLVTPHVVMGLSASTKKLPVNFSANDLNLVREGMRKVITEGTGGLMNVSYVHIAGKTGTAQTGPKNKFVNSWAMGFFPYEDPQYAFVVLMERGPSEGELSAAYAARHFFDFARDNAPEYLQDVSVAENSIAPQ